MTAASGVLSKVEIGVCRDCFPSTTGHNEPGETTDVGAGGSDAGVGVFMASSRDDLIEEAIRSMAKLGKFSSVTESRIRSDTTTVAILVPKSIDAEQGLP